MKKLKKPKSSFRILHISDVHFFSLARSLSDFVFLKSFLRYLKALFFCEFKTKKLLSNFPDLIHDLDIDALCITGDLTLTSSIKEFSLAEKFISNLKPHIKKLYTLPGNHDVYTKKAFKKKIFFNYFENKQFEEKKFLIQNLTPNWIWISLDCSCKNSISSANGDVCPFMIKELSEILETLPKNKSIIIGNHYPIYPENNSPKHSLLNSHLLKNLFKDFPSIKLYLHGHEHTSCIKKKKNSPIFINSGSLSLSSQHTCQILDLSSEEIGIKTLKINNMNNKKPLSFSLEKEKGFQL